MGRKSREVTGRMRDAVDRIRFCASLIGQREIGGDGSLYDMDWFLSQMLDLADKLDDRSAPCKYDGDLFE